MRIAIVLQEWFPVPPIRGGAVETIAQELAERLVEHEVHFFCVSDPRLPLEERRGHIIYHRWRKDLLARLLLCTWKLPFKKSTSRLYFWPYAAWVARRLRRINPDLVHVMCRVQFLAAIRKAVPNAAVLLSVHQASDLKASELWRDRGVLRCDAVTGVSKFIVDEIRARTVHAGVQIAHLPNGLDVGSYVPSWVDPSAKERQRRRLGVRDNEFVILYAGRMVEQKGVHVLAEAFRELSGKYSELRLVLAGSFTYSDFRLTAYIEKLRQQLGPLADKVNWAGFVPRAEMTRWYAASDMVVLPSIGPEGSPMVVHEAMAMGLPVIAFRHGGAAELIDHGKTGLLVDLSEGSRGLAAAIAGLAADRLQLARFGRAARERAEKEFDWAVVAPRVLKLYREMRMSREASSAGSYRSRGSAGERKARVLLCESGSGVGGSAKYLNDLVGLLDSGRYSVQVAASARGPFIERIQASGIPVHLKSFWNFPWLAGMTARCPALFRYAAAAFAGGVQILVCVPAIAGWLRARRIRLVHLNNEVLSQIPLLLGAKLAGCKVVCHLQGWRPFTRVERLVIPLIDQMTCLSNTGAKHFENVLGRRVVGIPHALRMDGRRAPRVIVRDNAREALGAHSDELLISIVGRVMPWKGQDVFLKAIARVRQRFPNVRGLVVGRDMSPGQMFLGELYELAKSLGMNGSVRFKEFQEDVEAIYAASDIIVHASTQPEPFGLVILEAMAAGTPVVATNAGGVLDMMRHEETGLLVTPGSVDEMASAIERLIQDPDLRNRLSANARAMVEAEFTMDRNARSFMSLYESLLQRH